MCGLIAVLPAYDSVTNPEQSTSEVRATLVAIAERTAALSGAGTAEETRGALHELRATLRELVDALTTTTANHLLVTDTELRATLAERVAEARKQLQATGTMLDVDRPDWSADEVERLQAELRPAQDLVWTAHEDRLGAAERVLALAGETTLPLGASIAYFALDTVLESLDRLEVRGRDSAGVHLWVQLDPADLATLETATPHIATDRDDTLFRSGSMLRLEHGVSVVYKTAAMIGRLGDNVRALRAELAEDTALRELLRLPSARVSVVAHTRWASVGKISEPNAHPLNAVVSGTEVPSRYVIGAVNGDVDNYLDLSAAERLVPDPEITTDAKLVPVLIGRRLAAGATDAAAVFNDCLRSFRGSMAIATQAETDPDTLLLGVKGGGQGLYVGLSPVGYVIASEVFGLVSQAESYLRIETGDGGQAILAVNLRGNGTLSGVREIGLDGRARELPDSALRTPEVATRDVTRGEHERYLEKELAEAPAAFRKTLRGRIHERDGQLSIYLPESTLPAGLREALRDGKIDEIVVIGQGTAAVAASGIAQLIESLVGDRLRVRTMPATELSAWHLHRDLSRTCIIPVSQSGTTTDTNRTVDLVRARGARVIAVVNRRESDLVAKSDGVLYTSDGRDIEMAVASTKAFYAQVAAGMLLAVGIGKEIGALDEHAEDNRLRLLLEMPEKLLEVQRNRAAIAAVAERTAGRYRYSAVLGSGPNRIAAAEVRIKLSELCYCGVSADAVEDKKHIDLSAESLVLVCAAGTPVTQTHDLIKEVDIFAAHHNQPVMIVDAGTGGLWSTDLVIEVPPTHPALAWVLSTAAGHYFAYYSARAIEAAGDDLRFALTALDSAESGGAAVASARLTAFLADTELGRYRGVLSSDTALRLAKTGWLLDGTLPVEQLFPDLAGRVDPTEIAQQVLTTGIDELTRSIDSVKHQAKTVTVGTSRSGVDLFDNALTRAALELGADREGLSYTTLVALRDYSAVTAAVTGAVRYKVSGPASEHRIRTVHKTGAAAGQHSRADGGTALSGTKKLAVDTRTVRLERGQSDGRLVLIIPEQSGGRIAGISLLHIELAERAAAETLLAALRHQGSRLPELQAAITERDLPFEPKELAELTPETVLLSPITAVAATVGA